MEPAPTSAHLGYTRIPLSGEGVQDHHRGGSIELSLINGWLGVFRVRGGHSKGLNIMWEDVVEKAPSFNGLQPTEGKWGPARSCGPAFLYGYSPALTVPGTGFPTTFRSVFLP